MSVFAILRQRFGSMQRTRCGNLPGRRRSSRSSSWQARQPDVGCAPSKSRLVLGVGEENVSVERKGVCGRRALEKRWRVRFWHRGLLEQFRQGGGARGSPRRRCGFQAPPHPTTGRRQRLQHPLEVPGTAPGGPCQALEFSPCFLRTAVLLPKSPANQRAFLL